MKRSKRQFITCESCGNSWDDGEFKPETKLCWRCWDQANPVERVDVEIYSSSLSRLLNGKATTQSKRRKELRGRKKSF